MAVRRDYGEFLATTLSQLNSGRKKRLDEELKLLRRLPAVRLDGTKRLKVRVGPGSTIRVLHNVYSVHSRMIGEVVDVRVHAEKLEVWYAQRIVETLPRLRGRKQHRIDYSHVVDWLVRKPGAFRNYRYREELFPTGCFKLAYDTLVEKHGERADKEYRKILMISARESETLVSNSLGLVLNAEQTPTFQEVAEYVAYELQPDPIRGPLINEVDLSRYDSLLEIDDEEAA